MLVKSINYWSFPGAFSDSPTAFEAIGLAKQYGFDAVELCVGEPGTSLGTDADEALCRRLRDEADRVGIKILSVASGLYWFRNLGDQEAAKREHAKRDLEKMIQITSWLGARTLLTIPGAVEVFFMPDRPVQNYEFVYEHATKGIRELLPLAEECGVRLGIENVWNKFLMSPREMAAFIDQFQSPWVGAYVDVANLQSFGFAEQWVEILGHRVVGVHFKDFRKAVGTVEGFVDLLEGDVNWPEVVAALQKVGYDGPVAAEMIPAYKHHAMVRVANTSRAMDAILGKA